MAQKTISDHGLIFDTGKYCAFGHDKICKRSRDKIYAIKSLTAGMPFARKTIRYLTPISAASAKFSAQAAQIGVKYL